MASLARRAFTNRWSRAIILGSLIGLVLFTALQLWRGRQHDTLVLQVQPLSDPNIIQVYVGGAVARPGLYRLPRGSRAAQAIDAAGGATADGDTTAIGMAAPLEDADQLIVPARRAAATPPPQGGSLTPPTVPPPGTAGQPAAPTPTASTSPAGPVNINTAGVADLDALPGIGPAIAQRVIDYREANGPFQTVEELAEVRGISEAMVAELRPLITLGP